MGGRKETNERREEKRKVGNVTITVVIVIVIDAVVFFGRVFSVE